MTQYDLMETRVAVTTYVPGVLRYDSETEKLHLIKADGSEEVERTWGRMKSDSGAFAGWAPPGRVVIALEDYSNDPDNSDIRRAVREGLLVPEDKPYITWGGQRFQVFRVITPDNF